jgi:hypothetical protein
MLVDFVQFFDGDPVWKDVGGKWSNSQKWPYIQADCFLAFFLCPH